MTPADRRAPRDLEHRTHRALSALPRPRAPRTLLPRVLAAIERPWYERTWLTWPVPAQAGSALLLVVMLAGAVWLASASESLNAVSALVRIGWRLLLQPAVAYAFTVAVVFSLVVAASWAAVRRVALWGIPE